MGLDISAYSKIEKVDVSDEVYESEWEKYHDGHCNLYVNTDFVDRADGLENGIYKHDEHHGFKSGSYGGHGSRRNHLAQIAGYSPMDADHQYMFSKGAWEATEGPFWELICMSDCEGVIGSKTSAKLYQDFVTFQPVIDTQDEDFQWWCGEWKKAFELAKDNGAVDFH